MEDILAAVVAEAERAQLRKRAVKLYCADRSSLATCARLLDLPKDEVQQILVEEGVRIRHRGTRREPTLFVDDEPGLARACAAEYDAGSTLALLSEKYVRSVSYIRGLVEREGVELRRKAQHSAAAPPDVKEQVVRLYRWERLSVAVISSRTGLTKYRIREILDEAKVEVRGGGRVPLIRPPTEQEAKAMERSYHQGHTLTELAELFPWTWRQIRVVLKERGVKLRGPGPVPIPLPRGEERAALVRRYYTGETLAQLADGTPWRKDQMRQLMHEEGVKMRRPGSRAKHTPRG